MLADPARRLDSASVGRRRHLLGGPGSSASSGGANGSLGWPFYQVPLTNHDLVCNSATFVVVYQGYRRCSTCTFLAIPFANALAGYTVFRSWARRGWLTHGSHFRPVRPCVGGHAGRRGVRAVLGPVCLWCAEDSILTSQAKALSPKRKPTGWLEGHQQARRTALLPRLCYHAWKPPAPAWSPSGES